MIIIMVGAAHRSLQKVPWLAGLPAAAPLPTPGSPTKILDFRGLDSSTILILRGGILISMENFL